MVSREISGFSFALKIFFKLENLQFKIYDFGRINEIIQERFDAGLLQL